MPTKSKKKEKREVSSDTEEDPYAVKPAVPKRGREGRSGRASPDDEADSRSKPGVKPDRSRAPGNTTGVRASPREDGVPSSTTAKPKNSVSEKNIVKPSSSSSKTSTSGTTGAMSGAPTATGSVSSRPHKLLLYNPSKRPGAEIPVEIALGLAPSDKQTLHPEELRMAPNAEIADGVKCRITLTPGLTGSSSEDLGQQQSVSRSIVLIARHDAGIKRVGWGFLSETTAAGLLGLNDMNHSREQDSGSGRSVKRELELCENSSVTAAFRFKKPLPGTKVVVSVLMEELKGSGSSGSLGGKSGPKFGGLAGAVPGLSKLRFEEILATLFEGGYFHTGEIREFSFFGAQYRVKFVRFKITGGAVSSNINDTRDAELPWFLERASSEFKIVDEETENLNAGDSVDGLTDAMKNLSLSAKENEKKKNNSSQLTGFAQVGGLRDVIDELKSILQKPLEQPELYLKFGVTPPKGVLLYGPPGTGKTLLAKALSEELNVQSELLQASDLVSKYSGETEDIIKSVFERLTGGNDSTSTSTRGSLLFIDEIDAICPRREDCATEQERRIVATFLTLLDGIDAKKNKRPLVLLGATNRPNALDPAIRRAGRLDRELEIGAPNALDRFAILKVHLGKMAIRAAGSGGSFSGGNYNGGNKSPINISDEGLRLIAADCHGYVGADLANLCSQVALLKMSSSDEIHNDPINGEVNGEVSPSRRRRPSARSSGSSPNSRPVDSSLPQQEEQKDDSRYFHLAMRSIKPSALKELYVEVPNTRWHNIGGYEKTKTLLQQSVEWPLKHAEVFKQMNLSAPRGVLLYGPPGCSKTMMAKAVATESKMNFVSVKGPELFSKYVGESEKKVREIFRKARQAAPCVIFFDEIDSMATNRESGDGSSGVGGRVLSQLLNEMDGIDGAASKELIIIAATNRPEALDPAIMRPGRFDRLLYVPLPDSEARGSILKNTLGKMKCGFDVSGDKGGILEDLVEKTEGFSGAEIVNVCKEAGMLAVRERVGDANNAGGAGGQRGELVLTVEHLLGVLATAKPRISPEAVRFYDEFEKGGGRA